MKPRIVKAQSGDKGLTAGTWPLRKPIRASATCSGASAAQDQNWVEQVIARRNPGDLTNRGRGCVFSNTSKSKDRIPAGADRKVGRGRAEQAEDFGVKAVRRTRQLGGSARGPGEEVSGGAEELHLECLGDARSRCERWDELIDVPGDQSQYAAGNFRGGERCWRRNGTDQ